MSRKSASGWLLLCLVLSTIIAGVSESLPDFREFWPAGLFAVVAGLLLLPDTVKSQRVQFGLLISIGMSMLLYGSFNGVPIPWASVISQNTGLLTMVVSVGLLKLLMQSRLAHKDKLPVGKKAYWNTLVSLSLFGSVINISAPVLIGDRLTLNRPMDYFTAASVSRVFCACSTWSPFFAGTAVVLTAVPGASIVPLMINGLPLLIFVLLAQYFVALFWHREKLENFHGYPLQLESLWVPFTLACLVMLSSVLLPSVSILISIAVGAILLTIVTLFIQTGLAATALSLHKFVIQELPKSLNELQLFLSAGVLAAGLKSMVQVGIIASPITHYSALAAAQVLALMVIVAAMGVHPIIQIAAITPLLLETNPDPILLGLTYMFAWGLGTAASPLSGTQLVIQGRYGIAAWRGAVQNWPFVAIAYFVAIFLLWVGSSIRV